MAKILVILRHENSLNVVRDYLVERNLEPVLVALDPVELPGEVGGALAVIRQTVQENVDVIVLGTKVYDSEKSEKIDAPKRLMEFLELLKGYGVKQQPVLLTHLAEMPANLLADAKATGLAIDYVENDNLKRDGMSNLGPLIDKALKL